MASLLAGPAAFAAEEQVRWAAELLPGEGSPAALAPVPPAAGAAESPEEEPPLAGGRAPPLRGVRFAAMSAPGPSGARPEHLREALAARSRQASNRLLTALDSLMAAAARGVLPEGMRWLTRSRLVFLKKKHGFKPRPIRVGELLRRMVAKRLVHDHRGELQRFFLRRRQSGIAIPGGAEALVHVRADLEAHARAGHAGPLVAVGLDLVNAFLRFF